MSAEHEIRIFGYVDPDPMEGSWRWHVLKLVERLEELGDEDHLEFALQQFEDSVERMEERQLAAFGNYLSNDSVEKLMEIRNAEMFDKYCEQLEREQYEFKEGDVVCRIGKDWHVILDTYGHKWLNMDVLCIKGSWWCKIGECESNLIRRYKLISKAEDVTLEMRLRTAVAMVLMKLFDR